MIQLVSVYLTYQIMYMLTFFVTISGFIPLRACVLSASIPPL
jgi:hypothetical protein